MAESLGQSDRSALVIRFETQRAAEQFCALFNESLAKV
jgi:hypothetical protein